MVDVRLACRPDTIKITETKLNATAVRNSDVMIARTRCHRDWGEWTDVEMRLPMVLLIVLSCRPYLAAIRGGGSAVGDFC